MRILIIICMIVSFLITPWSLVFGAAGIAYGVTGAVAALMQSWGYPITVVGDNYTIDDIGIGISDMMDAYAAHVGSTVAALFPQSSLLYTAGSAVLTYGSDFLDGVKQMIGYYSTDGVMDYSIDNQTSVSFGSGTVYKLPYTFNTSAGNRVTVSYSGSAPPDSVYMCIAYHSSWGYYVEVDDFSNTSGGSVTFRSSGNTSGTERLSVDDSVYSGHHFKQYFYGFSYSYGNPLDMYVYSTTTYPPYVLAKYYYQDQVTEQVSSIVITGSDALPDTSDDTSLMIPGIGTAGTLDTAGEQILDMVLDGALDIVTQLPEGDPSSPDLFDVFPFCLPYDMYRLLHVFDAEPQAPVIHWPIKIDSMSIDEELIVDLSEWDSVASLLRHLETIVFIVGLALITRKWIGAE